MSQPQPAPYPYYLPQPHSHDKYVAAIIIGVVVTAVVAGAIGYGLGSLGRILGASPQPAAGFTLLHGTVTVRAGTPTQIAFAQNATSVYPASVVSGAYSITLRSGLLYVVGIQYNSSPTPYGTTYGVNCYASPGTIAPSGADETQNFSC